MSVFLQLFGATECQCCGGFKFENLTLREINDKINNEYRTYINPKWILLDFIFGEELGEELREDLDIKKPSGIDFKKSLDIKVEVDTSIEEVLSEQLLCEKCLEERLEELEEKFNKAYSTMHEIEVYESGKIREQEKWKLEDARLQNHKIESYSFQGGKNNTIDKMKFWAAWEGYDVIYNITCDHDIKMVTGVFAKYPTIAELNA